VGSARAHTIDWGEKADFSTVILHSHFPGRWPVNEVGDGRPSRWARRTMLMLQAKARAGSREVCPGGVNAVPREGVAAAVPSGW
jgi:hypothetical protein